MKQRRSWRDLSLITTGITVAVISLQASGVLQLLEWTLLNQWFRIRPLESRTVPIVLVTISETDIRWAERWPLSDAQLAALLQRLKRDRPIAIGLDLYRDLPVEPGHSDLLEVFQTTPNLIGIKKAIGTAHGPAVASPPILRDRNQVAINDLLVDADGVVRRNLLSVNCNGEDTLSLGTKLALMYLQRVGIMPQTSANSTQVNLGQARFQRLSATTGGYVGADTDGFQTLANFLQIPGGIPTISFKAVMTNQVPAHFFKEKLVFVGAKAESVWGDRFYTPYTTDITTAWTGVELHANLAAQMISSAMDGRPLLQGLPRSLNWLWILIWAAVGSGLGWSLRSFKWTIVLLPLCVGAIFAIAYSAFLVGWWTISVAPALAFITATSMSRGYWVWEALKQANQQLEQKVQERTQELIEKKCCPGTGSPGC
jgi:CHASE2 domain-containing sensor protein